MPGRSATPAPPRPMLRCIPPSPPRRTNFPSTAAYSPTYARPQPATRAQASTNPLRGDPCRKNTSNLSPQSRRSPKISPALALFGCGFAGGSGADGRGWGRRHRRALVEPIVAVAFGKAEIIESIHVFGIEQPAPHLIERLCHIGHVEPDACLLGSKARQRELQAPARLEREADRAAEDARRRRRRHIELGRELAVEDDVEVGRRQLERRARHQVG